MTESCTIVAYHYVRNMPYSRYPKIKGLLVDEFKAQIEYFKNKYQFVTIQNIIDTIEMGRSLKDRAVLLTFDDGYLDHYTHVFPILEKEKIQGCFFPSVRAITENIVLNVNKIHFVLATDVAHEKLVSEIFYYLNQYRQEFRLKSNEILFETYAKANRFDPKEVVFIKHILQYVLDEKLQNIITNELFKKYVTSDEKAFSNEIYMNIEQLQCMQRNGMYIGCHGYNHLWLGEVSEDIQEDEIDKSLVFLKEVGFSTKPWVMCYPSGNYNDSLIKLLKKKKCALGLTVNKGVAKLTESNRFFLERMDTNDFPKNTINTI